MIRSATPFRIPGVVVAALSVVAALCAVGLLASAQDSQSIQRFLARTDVVLLDVSVLDRSRHPVRDLTAADFTILEDGKPHTVEYFQQVELPAAPSGSAAWMRDVAPDGTAIGTLTSSSGRSAFGTSPDTAVSVFGSAPMPKGTIGVRHDWR